MWKIQFRDYQRHFIEALESTDQNRLVESATGSGKTFTFCGYVSRNHNRTLILLHRDELLEQTSETLDALGVSHQIINANTKRVDPNANVFVAMVSTIINRLKVSPNYVGYIDEIIVDECHNLGYLSTLEFFPLARRIGFTATPITYKKDFNLSKIFNEMLPGPSIKRLIEDGNLVQDVNYYFPLDEDQEKDLTGAGSFGDFSKKSLNKVFKNPLMNEKIFIEYNKKLDSQKTMIYCASTEHVNSLTEFFLEKGINARSYTSKSEEARTDIVEWLKSNDDAVLISLEVFTTGLDVKDIRGIILARSTMSKSLYLQMVGRGGRSTDEVFKDHFIVLDFGNNISRFGLWSMDRDWSDDFHGVKKGKAGVAPVKECPHCYRINAASATKCVECNHEFPKRKEETIEIDINVKLKRPENFKVPKVDIKKLYYFGKSKRWKTSAVVYMYLDKLVRQLRLHEVTIKEFELNWRTYLVPMGIAMGKDLVLLEKLTYGGFKPDVNFYKKELVNKLKSYYKVKTINLAGSKKL